MDSMVPSQSNALPHRHGAAIEHDSRPSDIRRIVTGQENRHFAHVRWQAQPLQWRARDFLCGALRFDKRLTAEPFGDNDAWGNGVDADVVRAELRRQGIRQLPQPAFARVVGAASRAGATIVSRCGCDVDNDTATPLQGGESVLSAEPRPFQVDVYDTRKLR